MIGLLQRVSGADVSVDGRVIGEIGRGLLVLVAVRRDDGERDIARLGPAVRSLLQSENPQAPSGGVAASLQKDSYGYDDTPMQWKGPRCPSMIMAHIEGAAGRMALLKHWLFIALRSRSCATATRSPAMSTL